MTGMQGKSSRAQEGKQDCNYLFLKKWEKKDQVDRKLLAMVVKIGEKLRELQEREVEQWRAVLMRKCNQLKHFRRISNLKDTLRVIVYVCRAEKLDYDREKVQCMIRQVYYDQGGKGASQVMDDFRECGMDMSEYEVLEYQDNLLTRMLRYVSDLF